VKTTSVELTAKETPKALKPSGSGRIEIEPDESGFGKILKRLP